MPDAPERKTPTPQLNLPDLAFAASYLDAVREGFTDSTNPDRPMPDAAQIAADLPGHLLRLNRHGQTAPDGMEGPPPTPTHFWLVMGADFIGRTSLRTELDADLLRWGGHIGYAIRPGRRRQGFGHVALALAKRRAAAHGLTRVLLTCDDANLASIRIIEAGGGVLQDIAPHPTDATRLARRYWLGLTP